MSGAAAPALSPLADPPRPSLKQRQSNALAHMIAMHEAPREDGPEELAWKVLIYDKHGRDILSPLMTVGELREKGVTLHMLLTADRQPIADVPAVYLIEPTEESIARIGRDLAARLYERFYVCFTSAVPRPLLERLASSAVQTDSAQLVAGVFDEYVDFISLEDRLFSLNQPDIYRLCNSPASSEADIEAAIDRIVTGLFSVLVTLGEVPIIRCPRGNAAAMVAERLDARLRSHLGNARSNLFDESLQSSAARPVLVLLDRNLDLGSMLQHTWAYQPLLNDVMNMRLNKVTVEEADGGAKRRTYDVSAADFFMQSNAHLPFPMVAENVDVELKKYKEDYTRVSSMTGANADAAEDAPLLSVNTESLRSAVSALPELKERKRILDMHMHIASALLAEIKKRSLDSFVALEEAVAKQTKASVLEVVRDASRGTPDDKVRLVLLFLMAQTDESAQAALFDEFEAALREVGCSTNPLTYIKQVRAFLHMNAMTSSSASSSSRSATDLLGKWGISESIVGGVVDNAVQMLKTGVTSLKNILPSNTTLPATRIVEAIMEGKAHADADNYLYFDPRTSKRGTAAAPPKTRATYTEAIVVMIGGGNYTEYHNLQQYARKQLIPPVITYGATDLLSPSQFIAQLDALGAK